MNPNRSSTAAAVNLPLLVRAVLFAATLWVLAWYAQVAWISYPGFDGALNLNVSKSVLDGDGYGSFYEDYALFPVETQTNGPYVLPAAASLAAFGLVPFGGQAVNLLYLVACIALAALLARRVGGSWTAGALAALLAVQAPGMREFAMHGFGEVPAVTWLLAACLALAALLQRPRPMLAFAVGALLGLSLLTKTVSLIWFPPVLGVAVLWRWHGAGWRAALLDALRMLAGIVAAMLLWELYRWATLGSLAAYHAWWTQQIEEIGRQSGMQSGLYDTPVLSDKLRLHVATLGSYLGMLWPWQGIYLASVALLAACAAAKADVPGRAMLLALGGIVALYLVWWLAITPTEHMWLRRIMLGLLLCQVLAATSAAVLWRTGGRGMRAAAVVLLLPALWVALWNQNLAARSDPRPEAEGVAALIDAVRALPDDAVLFGTGWWQAPVIALYAERRIHDEERWTPQRLQDTPGRKFLVLDSVAVALGAAARERLHWRCDCVPVYAGSGGRIYEIRALRDSPAQAAADSVRMLPDDDIDAVGLSASEGGYRWAEQRVTIRLPHGRFERATLEVRTREPAAYGLDGVPLRMTAALGTCPLGEFELHPGDDVIQLDGRCAGSGAAELHLQVSARLLPEVIAPDHRALAWVFVGLELFGGARPAD